LRQLFPSITVQKARKFNFKSPKNKLIP